MKHADEEVADAQMIGLVADVSALTHIAEQLEEREQEKALKNLNGYLGVLREHLIVKQRKGISSPEIERLVDESGRVIGEQGHPSPSEIASAWTLSSQTEEARGGQTGNCPPPPADLRVQNALYETGATSSTLVELLSGNAERATRDLGAALVVNVTELNLYLKDGPCRPDQASIDRIYSMLRVVAAIDHKTPVAAINADKETQKILERAIENNPKHYKQLLERSEDWGHGIK
jgi:hypothetical protein